MECKAITKKVAMTKKKEASKSNPSTEIVQNAVYKPKTMQLDTFINYKTMLQEPLTTTNLERLCRDLTAWAMGDENALKVTQFLEGRGINQRTWTRWVAKYEILAEANDFAMMCIGTRREIGLITRKLDSQSTTVSMLLYDPQWRDIFAMKAKLMAQEGLQSGQRIVVLEKFPNSDLVPIRKTEEGG
jgi:hypothetical protein